MNDVVIEPADPLELADVFRLLERRFLAYLRPIAH